MSIASARRLARTSGIGGRSQRIRTYNFPQGRVTDHRINLTLHKLDAVLDGSGLDEMIDALTTEHQASQLAAMEGEARGSAAFPVLPRPCTIDQAARSVAGALRAGGIDCPDQEARELVLMATALTPLVMVTDSRRPVSEAEFERIETVLSRRLAREPLTRIAGQREFYGRDFLLSPCDARSPAGYCRPSSRPYCK